MHTDLSPQQTRQILEYLEITPDAPSLALLDRLLDAYTRHVPWESFSRIARRAQTGRSEDCPRWSDTFWRSAIEHRTGGTCFESNRAFAALLGALGFDTYLTINNMQSTIGCHTATIVRLDGRRYVADVGYPLHAALPIDGERPTQRPTPLLDYSATPIARDEYVIENQPHPRPYMFTLLDRAVDDTAYCAATTADYGPGGFFLDRAIARKLIDGAIWRFDSHQRPFQFEVFERGAQRPVPIAGDVAAAVSLRFGIDRAIVAAALRALAIDRS